MRPQGLRFCSHMFSHNPKDFISKNSSAQRSDSNYSATCVTSETQKMSSQK